MNPVLFTLPLRDGLLSIATTTGIINFKLITAQQALALWLEGSPYVHITAAGARQMLRPVKVRVLLTYLGACKTVAEVRALGRVHPTSATLRKACTLRIRAMGWHRVREGLG